jgi:hypothetical protein
MCGLRDDHEIRDGESLPTEEDFDPYHGDLDAQSAWQNFGGLTLEEANRRFREKPITYQEDFMFMGGKAFAYYYPVIDSFLRETAQIVRREGDNRGAWILARCIQVQFQAGDLEHVMCLKSQILELVDFVRQNVGLFSDDADELREIDLAWKELQLIVQSVGT